jgi:hypothetical protein
MELGGTTTAVHKPPKVQRRVGISRDSSNEGSSLISPSTKANIGSGLITTGIGAGLLAGAALMFKTEAGSSEDWWGSILTGAKWLSIPAGIGIAIAGIARCLGFGGSEETEETGKKSLADLAEETTPEFVSLESVLSNLKNCWTAGGMNTNIRQALEGVNDVGALTNQNQAKLVESIKRIPLKAVIKLLKSNTNEHVLVLAIKALNGHPELNSPQRWFRTTPWKALERLTMHPSNIVQEAARDALRS